MFAAFEQAPDRLFDSVHQVRMPRWHSGRVVLVGDAAGGAHARVQGQAPGGAAV
ncbi:hypothetical protein AB0J28_42760 [Streptosporangium canum]|uniref:hypothetical protein n=1 Tax=Streptosporangium canum TaxID=324952 RepID=UPI00341F16C6